MGSLVGHLYPRLVRLALRVKEHETKMSYARAVCSGLAGNRRFPIDQDRRPNLVLTFSSG